MFDTCHETTMSGCSQICSKVFTVFPVFGVPTPVRPWRLHGPGIDIGGIGKSGMGPYMVMFKLLSYNMGYLMSRQMGSSVKVVV